MIGKDLITMSQLISRKIPLSDSSMYYFLLHYSILEKWSTWVTWVPNNHEPIVFDSRNTHFCT